MASEENKALSDSMVVKLENLDQLLTLAGEVIITSSNLDHSYKNLLELHSRQEKISQETLSRARDIATSTALLSSNLHHLVQVIRTVDLKDLHFRCRRLVRDISRKTGKRIQFIFEGEETSVDKTIIEKLHDPIAHQLRNAIDHGIEESALREKAGKPPEGTIILRAYNSEHETIIEIEDDGRGLNLQALEEKGIASGIISAGSTISNEEYLNIMCSPGVSTAEVISEVSGRGVGMDVVREQIHALDGSISFTTTEGKGSCFTFRIPLLSAVNIMDALIVRGGKTLFAFPISSVISNMAVPAGKISFPMQGGRMVEYLGHMLPLFTLTAVLDKSDETDEETPDPLPVLVIEHKDQMAAFVISEFYSPQKLVIIPFEEGLSVQGLSGTTILGNKSLGFIIDVPSLLNRALGKSAAKEQQEKHEGKTTKPPVTGVTEETIIQQEVSARDNHISPAAETTKEEQQISVPEFILEIERLLPVLNKSIFALEQSPSDDHLINESFRYLHTIKGNFLMIGYPHGAETVHSIESLLDKARAGKLSIEDKVMDVLMDGIGYIEEVIEKSKGGNWQDTPSEEIISASARLMPEPVIEETADSIDVHGDAFVCSHEAAHRMVMYRKRKVPFYSIYVEFDAGSQPSFLVACLIYKRVSETGDIVATVPSLVDVERGIMEGKFKMLLATECDAETLKKNLKDLLTLHYGANIVQCTRFD